MFTTRQNAEAMQEATAAKKARKRKSMGNADGQKAKKKKKSTADRTADDREVCDSSNCLALVLSHMCMQRPHFNNVVQVNVGTIPAATAASGDATATTNGTSGAPLPGSGSGGALPGEHHGGRGDAPSGPPPGGYRTFGAPTKRTLANLTAWEEMVDPETKLILSPKGRLNLKNQQAHIAALLRDAMVTSSKNMAFVQGACTVVYISRLLTVS